MKPNGAPNPLRRALRVLRRGVLLRCCLNLKVKGSSNSSRASNSDVGLAAGRLVLDLTRLGPLHNNSSNNPVSSRTLLGAPGGRTQRPTPLQIALSRSRSSSLPLAPPLSLKPNNKNSSKGRPCSEGAWKWRVWPGGIDNYAPAAKSDDECIRPPSNCTDLQNNF